VIPVRGAPLHRRRFDLDIEHGLGIDADYGTEFQLIGAAAKTHPASAA
jgi:hypothetical protein